MLVVLINFKGATEIKSQTFKGILLKFNLRNILH